MLKAFKFASILPFLWYFLVFNYASLVSGSRLKSIVSEHVDDFIGSSNIDISEPISNDLISNLPGAPPHTFKQYSGYVSVDDKNGRKLFYWFVEAESDPSDKPLTLWLNGGPGCSSIGGGALSELGPFFPSKNGSHLIYNKHSWIQESNVLFLESPAGVGFSYSDTPSDYVTGDAQTAEDSRTFVLGWLERFPQYKNRPFFISGESYAGHYVVDLAYLLVKKEKEDAEIVNFKGFLLGNPWTVTASDFKGMADFWWTHSLISTKTYREFLAFCTPTMYEEEEAAKECYKAATKADKEMGSLNPYDVYVDTCTSGPSGQAKKLLSHAFQNSRLSSPLTKSYDPCIDDEVEAYLNLPLVQKAIHAHKLPYRWTDCTDIIDYSLEDFAESKMHIWEKLLKTDLRITVFSGDVDGVCPTIGTRDWLARLEDESHLKLTKQWRPWVHENQVGGYTEEYNGGKFKFVTVRNAGHMVPYTQPSRALALFKNFINGDSMPKADNNDARSIV